MATHKRTNPEIVAGYRAARAGGDVTDVKRWQTLIVLQNQGLVRTLVNRFVPSASEADKEDAMQAGSMGLLRALEDYDPEKSSFSTYAAHWVRDHIQRWAGKPTAVSRPRSASMPASVARAAARFRMQFGREPSAADLGVTDAQLVEWSEGSHYVYLDEDASEEHGRAELTADASEAQHTIDRMALEAAWEEAVKRISPRNAAIAEDVLWHGKTTVETAAKHGITQGFVVQICQRVEELLKRAVARSQNPPSSRPRHVLVQEHLARAKAYRGKARS
jgi:RNA polymerase sigma factor (sigma-70 family)